VGGGRGWTTHAGQAECRLARSRESGNRFVSKSCRRAARRVYTAYPQRDQTPIAGDSRRRQWASPFQPGDRQIVVSTNRSATGHCSRTRPDSIYRHPGLGLYTVIGRSTATLSLMSRVTICHFPVRPADPTHARSKWTPP